MCDMKSNQSDFCDHDIIDMSQQFNVRFLLELQEVPQHINLKHSPQFVKQRIEEWHSMHKKCCYSWFCLYCYWDAYIEGTKVTSLNICYEE